jgi:hypothetical protein
MQKDMPFTIRRITELKNEAKERDRLQKCIQNFAKNKFLSETDREKITQEELQIICSTLKNFVF